MSVNGIFWSDLALARAGVTIASTNLQLRMGQPLETRQTLALETQKLALFRPNQLGKDEKWNGETGFIHLSVDKYLESGLRRQAFLCGPPPMINAVTRVLQEKGTEDTFYDEF